MSERNRDADLAAPKGVVCLSEPAPGLNAISKSALEALRQAALLGAACFACLVLSHWTIAFWGLYLPGLLLAPAVVALATRRRPVDSSLAFFALLPFFAYAMGVLANCLAFTMMGASSFWWTLSSAAPADTKLYGLYGIPAAILFVLCVLRFCIPLAVRAGRKRRAGD